MSVLPANFFRRYDLQALISRADGLLHQLEDEELLFAVQAFQRAAAGLDGLLADLKPTNHHNDCVLDNAKGWQTDWVGQSWDFKSPGPIEVARQFLVNHGQRIATGRFRVTHQGEVTISANIDLLSEIITRYLLKDWDELPSQLVEGCLSSLEG